MTLLSVIIIGKILRDKVIIFIYVSRLMKIFLNVMSYTICLAKDVSAYFWEKINLYFMIYHTVLDTVLNARNKSERSLFSYGQAGKDGIM